MAAGVPDQVLFARGSPSEETTRMGVEAFVIAADFQEVERAMTPLTASLAR
jgi:hypothetical protein